MRTLPFIRPLLAGVLTVTSLAAQYQPGDVFREVTWRPRSTWARVTGVDGTNPGRNQFLPNPVHFVGIPDLADATRCEVMIEKLTSHTGTRNPRMRVNSNAWITIPEISNSILPGRRGRAGNSWEYQQMFYPVIDVPLAQLKTGTNNFEFACQAAGGSALGAEWPQWLHYGVTFRIYYKSSKAGAPSGEISSPATGDLVSADPEFVVNAVAASGSTIRRVDLQGDYYDFDWDGDGSDSGWHGGTWRYGQLQHHMGSTQSAPWKITWNNAWVPTQPGPFNVIARIVASNGLIRVTESIRVVQQRDKTVHRYLGSNIARHWQTSRQFLHSNNNYITGDLTKADAAQFTVSTWNGTILDQLRLNGQFLRGGFGKAYDQSYDSIAIPLNRLRAGGNIFETIATTQNHGIEVNWPGIEIFVRYDIPESTPQYLPYGRACSGSAGTPVLSSQGTPRLTRTYTVELSNAPATTPVIILNGFSKDIWNSFPLPFDWTPLGAPGCLLQTSVEFTVGTATNASGNASFPYSVPNRTEFLGGSLFSQFAIFDPTANSLGLTFSNAGRWVFGR